jgi:hypothetical protein
MRRGGKTEKEKKGEKTEKERKGEKMEKERKGKKIPPGIAVFREWVSEKRLTTFDTMGVAVCLPVSLSMRTMPGRISKISPIRITPKKMLRA